MINLLDYDLCDLKNWMTENAESSFRAKQVFDWIYKGIWEFDDMKNIPSSTKDKLKKHFYIEIPEAVKCYVSSLKDTYKYLLKFRDGNIIECVIMKYNYGNSICISTQIGCRMGCRFCASTIDGMVRNLTCGEILSEILCAQKESGQKISNIVLMGSGEPLDNYDNVVKFIKMVNSDYGLNIGQRHITLSTCGIVPKIKEFADLKLQVTLAISLHSPYDESRREMMPIAYKYSIYEIIEACRYYILKTGRRITFEYALVKGVNDSEEYAKKLVELLKGLLCHVNLIPVNEVKEKQYYKSSPHAVKQFENILTSKGIETTVRREMGSDINAACGQLKRRYVNDSLKGC